VEWRLLGCAEHAALNSVSLSASPLFYLTADCAGNLTVLINTNQLIIVKYLYDPFGNILSMADLWLTPTCIAFRAKSKCQSSLLTLVGGSDNLLPCRANCALSILGRCTT